MVRFSLDVLVVKIDNKTFACSSSFRALEAHMWQACDIRSGAFYFSGRDPKNIARAEKANPKASVIRLLCDTPELAVHNELTRPTGKSTNRLPHEVIYSLMRVALGRVKDSGYVGVHYTHKFKHIVKANTGAHWRAVLKMACLGPDWRDAFQALISAEQGDHIEFADWFSVRPDMLDENVLLEFHFLNHAKLHLLCVTTKFMWGRAVLAFGSDSIMLYIPLDYHKEMKSYHKCLQHDKDVDKQTVQYIDHSLFWPVTCDEFVEWNAVVIVGPLGKIRLLNKKRPNRSEVYLPYDMFSGFMASNASLAKSWYHNLNFVCPGDLVAFAPENMLKTVVAVGGVSLTANDNIYLDDGDLLTDNRTSASAHATKQTRTKKEDVTLIVRRTEATSCMNQFGRFDVGFYKIGSIKSTHLGHMPVFRVERIVKNNVMVTLCECDANNDGEKFRYYMMEMSAFEREQFEFEWEAIRWAKLSRMQNSVANLSVEPGDLVCLMSKTLSKQTSFVHKVKNGLILLTNGDVTTKQQIFDVTKSKTSPDAKITIFDGTQRIIICEGSTLNFSEYGNKRTEIATVVRLLADGVVVDDMQSNYLRFYMFKNISIHYSL